MKLIPRRIDADTRPQPAPDRAADSASRSAGRLVWLDALKGFAMAWIILNHIVEKIAGGECMGNPDANWPPFHVCVEQFLMPASVGWKGVVLTAVRDVGWLGDQGVTLFLIASGFGIGSALLRSRSSYVAPGRFLWARAARIYPQWLGVHAALFVWLFVSWSKIGPGFVLSAAGIRYLPATVYAYVPAWWYVGLLLQLYAMVPLLWPLLCRFGARRVLLTVGGAALVVRGIGLFTFHDYLDAWSRGAIFVTRLPEFVFGMCFAIWYAADPAGIGRVLRRRDVRAAGIASFFAGFAAAFTLLGMTVAPFLMGVGAFVVLIPLLDGGPRQGFLAWLGRESYPIYLVHQPFVDALVPATEFVSAFSIVGLSGAALALACGTAWVLDTCVKAVGRALRILARRGPAIAAAALGAAGAFLYLCLFGADVAVARYAPLEIGGWGERPSLAADPAFGWNLAPSSTTRLRWTSYDYVVKANALGFPGPDVAPAKPPGALRLLVTGDAFTSGEGVGTDAAWPALLGPALERRARRKVQVLNFGITGYGPDQELRVIRTFVPRLRPDVVVLESFVNAFEKLDLDDDDLRRSIGFGEAPPTALKYRLRLDHLRAFLAEDVIDVARERISGDPNAEDVGLSDGSAFLRGDPDFSREATAYAAHVQRARDVARAAHAQFLLILIPSRAQACAASDFPRGAYLDLHDAAYDADRPQRTVRETARRLGVRYLDLGPALRAGGACRYQRYNMHFLESGDVVTAAAVADAVAAFAPR